MAGVRVDEKAPPGLPQDLVAPYLRIVEALLAARDFRSAAETLVAEVSTATGCEAVGLRVHDRKDDYPYFVTKGFDRGFVEKEGALCELDQAGRLVRCEGGRALLECVCGLVLRGFTHPSSPGFTEYGSFWTNSTTDLLADPPEVLGRIKTRRTCNAEGYESVALVPLRSGERTVGLVQANSRERGRFTPALLGFMERVARHAAGAVEASWRREDLDRLARELEERTARIETAVALGEMAAELAHEIKNPLAGMMLSASRLKKALDGLEGHERLAAGAGHLCEAVNALSETVTRLSGATRQPRVEGRDLDVNEVVESAAALVAPRAAEQCVVIVRDVAGRLPPVRGDAHFLMRAFVNLMANALDAMPSGGILYLGSSAEGDGAVRVSVGDTGPGVAPEEAKLLFKPFRSLKPGGTGLGLGIVRRIVELHSGSVSLGRREGGGAEAVVTLPARQD